MLLIFRLQRKHATNHVNLGCVQRPQGSQESKIALKIFLFHTYCDFHCEVLSLVSPIERTMYFRSRSHPTFELKREKISVCMK